MKTSVVIFNFGSIGERHSKILRNIFQIKDINIFTKRKIRNFKTVNNLSTIKSLNPKYFIIASPTSKHYKYLKFIENNFKNKIILVEKPLFDKFKKLNIKKNKVFVGYNLRFSPILEFIKKKISKKKIIDIKVICNSFLPNWRPNINYKNTSSAKKSLGGGVVLELSHELDYIRWIFGDPKIKFVETGKFSNLNIDTEDLLKLYGKIGNANLSLDINYYSRINKRTISIDGLDFSLFADFLKNKIEIQTANKKFIKTFPNKKNYTYISQHKEFLKGKAKKICSYKFALETMKIIDKIKRWKKN